MENIRTDGIWLESGLITEEQLEAAIALGRDDNTRRISDILVDLGFITEKQKIEALAGMLNIKTADINEIAVDTDAVALIPKRLAEKYGALCVLKRDSLISVLITDPFNYYAMEDIRQITGCAVEMLLAEREPLARAIDYYYSEVNAKAAARNANIQARDIEEIEIEDSDSDAPIIRLLDSLITRAYNADASDVHIEPFEDKTYVRMRIDGAMADYVTLRRGLHQPLIARIKIVSNLDIAEKRLPQDGHFRMKIGGESLNIRVSILPVMFGEKAVLRLLSEKSHVDNAGRFGMSEENYQKFSEMLLRPNGIIYLTGPTGSGKTTTLYMALEEAAKKPVNISTIEDPVEKNLKRINQTQVNNAAGMTFESGLRALLRQDPDVIMVGETRDTETARISVRAAITGHAVFSTLHTNDALSSIARLEDMGLEPYMVASSVVGIVAQRLMRRVCESCAYESPVSPSEEKAMNRPSIKILRRGRGCPACSYTGYRGRTAIHEVVLIDKTMKRLITQEASAEEMEEYAAEHQGFRRLRDSALDLVESGISTFEEYMKVAYYN